MKKTNYIIFTFTIAVLVLYIYQYLKTIRLLRFCLFESSCCRIAIK